VLRATAWDARLEQVDAQVVQEFEVRRRHYGGFLLLMQTLQWEFLTTVDDEDRAAVGSILPRSTTSPSTVP